MQADNQAQTPSSRDQPARDERAIRQCAQIYQRRDDMRRVLGKVYEPMLKESITKLRAHMARIKDDNPVSAAIHYAMQMDKLYEPNDEREILKQLAVVAALEITEGAA